MSDNEEHEHQEHNHAQPSDGGNANRGMQVLRALVPSKEFLITPLLVDICFVVFFAMAATGAGFVSFSGEATVQWGSNYSPLTLSGQWWRLLTSVFLHGGLLHIAFNMYALYYIGMLLERPLGKFPFLVAFLVTGVLSSLCSVWWHGITNSVGASGAIMGLFGIFIALLTTDLINPEVRKGLLKDFTVMVGLNLVIGLSGGIDNAAHVGGLVSGLVVGYAYYPLIKWRNRQWPKVAIPLLLLAITIGLVAFVLPRIPNYYGMFKAKEKIFSTNEAKALQYDQLPANTPLEERLQQLDSNGIRLWHQNVLVMDSVVNYPKMPEALVKSASQRSEYSKLRQKSYQLMYKRLQQNTDQFNDSISMLNQQADSIANTVDSTDEK